jgi:para-aminobenzoate synthetase/4-amino-4-deoxychorismate lyase
MRLIAAIESSPREVYTGCIGFIGPGRQARFSVAIRTAIAERRRGAVVYGVGGGIVWDSDADAEYEECLSKAVVLDNAGSGGEFELLETMGWTRRDGCRLLEEHLDRLADSARYFGFPCDPQRIEGELRAYLDRLGGFSHCIRLLLASDGAVRFEAREPPEADADTIVRLRLARDPVDLRNPFLYHKTTRRGHYDRARSAAGDCDDVLLWNERGEVTETTIANVVVRVGDGLYTPPVASGLLNGTLRRSLLTQGKIEERVVRVDELPTIGDLYLVNSVRGWRRAVIDERSTAGR